MELHAPSLTLRTVDDSDINEVARMWEWQDGPISAEKAQEAILWMQSNHEMNKQGYIYHLCFAISETGTNKTIGWCGLDGQCSPEKTVLFYSIHSDYQGRGYATQCTNKLFEHAFESIGMQQIDGGCYKDNIASYRVMEKAGMILLGYDKESGDPHFYIDKKIYFDNKKL